jgi:tartrate dehydratase alpha subunit/fumarate hydratase class I-like protein
VPQCPCARAGNGAIARDRAAAVAAAVLQIALTAPPDQRRQAVEAYLRDELSDITRTALNEICPNGE